MGIRISKIIGYGLIDVKYDTENWENIDPRFNPDGYSMFDSYTKEDEFSDEKFNVFIDGRIKSEETDELFDLELLSSFRKRYAEEDGGYKSGNSIFNVMNFDPEFGMPNVMVFIPPIHCKEWQRYDNIIDYYEPHHSDTNGGISTGFTLLDRPIFPWEGYNDISGEQVKRLTGLNLDRYLSTKWESLKQVEKFRLKVAKELGFNSVEDMFNNIVPMIPKELVAALQFLKVFKNDKTIYTLRPMIYWYWG